MDGALDEVPKLKRDVFWNSEVEPLYSKEAARSRQTDGLIGSVAKIGLVHERYLNAKLVRFCFSQMYITGNMRII